jgi:hypothetical protein
MQKTVKVEFSEQSKCVTAQVKVELEGDALDHTINTQTLVEAKELFIEAQKFAVMQTMKTKIN